VALREYQYLDTRVRCLPESLPGWPLAAAAPCGACAGYKDSKGSIHTMQFDCCFKLVSLKGAGQGGSYEAPDNRRLFAGDDAVTAFEESSEGYLKESSSGKSALQRIGLESMRERAKGMSTSFGPLPPLTMLKSCAQANIFGSRLPATRCELVVGVGPCDMHAHLFIRPILSCNEIG
jgi:hypothetical protein